MNLESLPLKALSRVYHVGTMNAVDKGCRGASFEGSGLSVSLHPTEWVRIAKLGGLPTFVLSKSDGLFLDFCKLGPAQRAALIQWAEGFGWVTHVARWQVSWLDEDAGTRCQMLACTAEEARLEVEDLEESCVEVQSSETSVPVLTSKALKRLGFVPPELSTPDILATFLAEDTESLDGVWWDEELAPSNLSAPRGVISANKLRTWSASKLAD